MERKKYFDNPTQVYYINPDDNERCAGIAYKDFIICACCGEVFKLEEVYEYCPSYAPPIEELHWIDFSYSIE